ncbi:MAG: helix-hairpin-helix domain-containing protein [Pirellulaceae bacterium]
MYIRCQNELCPAKLRQRLRFYAGRAAMDIDGLGEKIVDQLVDANLVSSFADLYRLDANKLLKLDSFGKRKAEKLLSGIEASKQRGLARVLSAISIRHVGKTVSKLVARKYPTLNALQAATVDDLAAIDEIGATIAASLHEYLHSDSGREVMQGLRDVGVLLEQPPEEIEAAASAASSVLAGKSVVVTGTLIRYKRDEIQELIAKLGGRPSSSISKSTHYLIAGEKAGSKLEKAQQLGVEILSEAQFEEMVNAAGT